MTINPDNIRRNSHRYLIRRFWIRNVVAAAVTLIVFFGIGTLIANVEQHPEPVCCDMQLPTL